MATKTTDEVTIADMSQGYARGGVVVEANQTKALRARILLAYLEAYHPKEHALFIAALGDIVQSFEDERFVEAVLRYAEGFLRANPEDQERLQSISPREMVEEVSRQLVEDAKTRRADIRRRASEIVKKYARGTTTKEQELQELEERLVFSINASINKAETPQQLRTAIEEEVAKMPLPAKEVVQQLIDADPLSAGRLLLTNPTRDSVVVGHITTLPAPAWRGYVAAVENLQMGPTETIDGLINRAKEIGQTTALLTAGLSQIPVARARPSSLISAILEERGNKDALRAFEKLTEEVKNAVFLAVVSNSWGAAVEIIRQRSGGVVMGALEEIIKQGNAQWGAHAGEPSGRAGSLISGILQEILSPAFVNYIDAKSLLQKLGGQDGDRVAAFIKSLPDAQRDGGAATTALFLAITTTWRPGDVRFEWQQAQDGGGLGAWAIQIVKDSALEKLFSKFVKSKAVEAAGGVVKKGGASLVAGILTKLGLSASADVLLAMIGTPVATAIKWVIQAAIWLGGYIWRPISSFLSKLARGEIGQLGAVQSAIKQTVDSWLGSRPPAALKQWYEQDWVVIIGVIVVAIFIPMVAMMPIVVRDSALVTSFEASKLGNSGGPYEEAFPPYSGPFPAASAVDGCPVTNGRITQGTYEGKSHGNVCAYDFGSSFGSPVKATHNGCVAAIRSDVPNSTFVDKSFGNYVRLVGTNPDGSRYYTTYAHFMSGSTLQIGQCVSVGDVVGYVDTTGFTFDAQGNLGGGTHLHYQFDGDGCIDLPAGCGAR